MTLLVRMHVYSGRPDPVWIVPEQHTKKILPNLEGIQGAGKPAGHRMGYRGFSVLRTDAGQSGRPMIVDTPGSNAFTGTFVSGAPAIEEYLLWTGKKALSDRLSTHARQAIEAAVPPAEQGMEALSCPPCRGEDAPAYEPDWWNDNADRKATNNCYAYANNQATNTFPQPGRGSGQMFTSLTCLGDDGVTAASVRDGLVDVPDFSEMTPGWYVALVIWPDEDYHWYRQDSNGCWSHKPGMTDVINVDHAGNRITDPMTADRGPYTTFCTYMITNSGVTIA